MSFLGVRNIRASHWAGIALMALAALALSVGEADARKKRKRVFRPAPPPLAHIVVDAKSGEVLDAKNADARRYPASLTKVMTLFLLFEQLESGKLKLDSPLKVSRYAARRPPSKLGLKPGSAIQVEHAIKALVTKSANDVATVVAEAIGGSESAFAGQMTRKARELGMGRTTYMNASGLPHAHQITTARDQAVLGRAIQERFPRHYKYFATSTFHYRGRAMRNHNKLLGNVRGVDGIKTGYIHASGYNLVSSVNRNKRHIVAVVLGGRTGRTRDAIMKRLIRDNIHEASTQPATPPVTASAKTAIETVGLPTPPARPSFRANATAKLANGADPTDPRTTRMVQAAGTADDLAKAATTAISAVLPGKAAVSGEGSYKVASATRPEARAADIPATPAPPEAQATQATRVAQTLRPVAPASVTAVRPGAIDADGPAHAALVTAGAVFESQKFPGWFPYMLVAFIGAAGSFASAFCGLVSRCVPRRRTA